MISEHTDEAISQYMRYVQMYPLRDDLQDEYGSLLAQKFDYEGEAKRFQNAIDLDSKLQPAFLHLGVIRWQQQQPEEALKYLQTAHQLNAQDAQASYFLGVLYAEQKQIPE